jgi:hypothetical protein
MTKTRLMKDMDEAMMVMKVAFRELVEAVQADSNVNNALGATRGAMARYHDAIDAVEAGTTPSLWDRFRSKDLLRKKREDAGEVLVAARKRLVEFRGYLANVQTSQASLT